MENSKIRIGKDFNVFWAIHKIVDGQRQPYDLEGKKLQLYYRTSYGKVEVANWKVNSNSIEWRFRGKEQKYVDDYELILVENADQDGMVTVDTCNAFTLVAHSCEERINEAENIIIEVVTLESDVALAPVVKEVGGGASEEDIQEIKNDIVDLQLKDVQTDAKLTELSAENEGSNSIAFNPFTRKGELFAESSKEYAANANYDSSELIEVAPHVIGRMFLAPSNGNIKISFFSAEKDFISNFYGESVGLQKLNIVPPSDAAYMVLTTLHSYSNQSYIITDLYSVINEVEELGAEIDGIKEKNEEVDATLDKIVPIIPQLDKFSVVASKNLLNPNDKDVLIGSLITADGFPTQSSNYNASGYIAVKPNTTYYKSIVATNQETRFRFVAFYDADKKVIAGGLSAFANEFTTPTNCAYVRVSIYASSWAFAQVAETYMEYVPYATSLGLPPSTIVDKERIATLNDISNPLYGKKWTVVGDSFTAEFANPPSDWKIEDGIYEGKSKVYGYLIANRNNMRLQWLGAGGKTMATPASGGFTNAFSLDEYKKIDADVDYITIYLGINDSHHAPGSSGDDGEDKTGEIPLGTIDDTTTATFYGAWNVVIPYLLENHPFAHIGIIVSNGCDTDEYRVAEIAIAKKYGIPYIDLNGDERTPFMLRSTNNSILTSVRNMRTRLQSIDYEGGNLHPNKDAHEFQASFIETWMRSL